MIVALFYLQSPLGSWLACGLFTIAAVTDFFDGYVARTWRQQSAFGRFLDPIADKLLVSATLLMLVGFGQIKGLVILPALVILCREIRVSGLREFLAEVRVGVPVSQLAKVKTVLQMVAIGFLIVGDAGPSWLPVRLIGDGGLWIAAVLTLVKREGIGNAADIAASFQLAAIEVLVAKALAALAGELKMAALIEVHDEAGFTLARKVDAQIIGINNRDLHSFQTHLPTTQNLLPGYAGDPPTVAAGGARSRPAGIRATSQEAPGGGAAGAPRSPASTSRTPDPTTSTTPAPSMPSTAGSVSTG